jgi:hypothetical protein
MAKKRTEEELQVEQMYEKQQALKLVSFMRESYFGEQKTATGATVRTNRAPKYDTIEELHETIEAYWNKLENEALKNNPMIPDVENFCLFAMISRSTFIKWKTPGIKSEAFREEVLRFETAIAAYKKQLMFRGEIPPVPALADLNNNHGYTNQTQTIRHEVIKELPTVEDVMSKLPQN